MNEEMLKRIKSLPPMPESVSKIQAICSNPNSGIADLIAVVEKDPSLTANLLKAANSPLYGFSREIKTVAQAVSLFGMATVKGFAIASAVRSSFKIDLEPYGITTDKFVKISEMQNSLVVRWYSRVDRSMLDILAPASFLLEIGKVMMAEFLKSASKGKDFKDKLMKKDEVYGFQSIHEIEKEFLEITSEEVAAKIFEHWNFENLMVESIRHSENPSAAPAEIQRYSQPLYIAKQLINIREQLSDEQKNKSIEYIKANELNEEAFKQALPESN